MEHTTAALVLDLLLGAVMLICVVSCYQRGFVSSLLRLVGAAAACVAAALLSRPVGSWLYDTFARERVHSYVEEKVASVLGGAAQDGLEALGGMRDAALDALSDLLEHFDFDIGFFSGEGTSGAAEKALEKLADGAGTAQAITEAAVEPAVLNIFSAAVFVVIFLSAQRLGGWFFPVLFAYFAILALAAAYLYHRKELLQLHALVGDETFYRLYPKEKKRDERRAERFRRKLQRDKERRMKRKDEL